MLKKNIYRGKKRQSNGRRRRDGIVWAVEQDVVLGGVEVDLWLNGRGRGLLVGVGVEGSLGGLLLLLVTFNCMVEGGVGDGRNSGVYLLREFLFNHVTSYANKEFTNNKHMIWMRCGILVDVQSRTDCI